MERLFSYGTLQLESVQLATFGRTLEGFIDTLPGFSQSMFEIDDPEVVEKSGKSHHPMATFTGRASDIVQGMVFRITKDELENADKYETSAYMRARVTLGSGRTAWVYVDARQHPPNP